MAHIPKTFIYGTAWKKERTRELVALALRTGFKGVDTACQPKHYNEAGVGEGIADAISEGSITRRELFLQTKFTPVRGQDPNNIPYNPNSPLSDQVKESFEVSLQNLKTSYIDSLVLHSPLAKFDDTITVWRAFEELHVIILT
jgi:diketogulonate reductase-like aldo/keto reductase